MDHQDKMDALSVLAKIKQYRSYQSKEVDSDQAWTTTDLENFTWFLDTVERLLTSITKQKKGEIDAESKRADLSKTYFTNEGLDLMLSGDKAIKILSRTKLKRMKKEVKLIEKWYPEGELTELEKMFKGIFPSLHEYQLLIARFRKGEINIFKDGNDIFITGNE